jgi:hypothetical protein
LVLIQEKRLFEENATDSVIGELIIPLMTVMFDASTHLHEVNRPICDTERLPRQTYRQET